MNNYEEWELIKNYWTNKITGEKRIWHPITETLGNDLYNKASKWCRKASDDRNKRSKGK